MAKTLIDLDEGLLAEAQRILGTATKKATVNAALGEVVRRDAAQRVLAQLGAGVYQSTAGSDPA